MGLRCCGDKEIILFHNFPKTTTNTRDGNRCCVQIKLWLSVFVAFVYSVFSGAETYITAYSCLLPDGSGFNTTLSANPRRQEE